jgi:hypothetical protein
MIRGTYIFVFKFKQISNSLWLKKGYKCVTTLILFYCWIGLLILIYMQIDHDQDVTISIYHVPKEK